MNFKHNLKTCTPIEFQAQFKDQHSNWSSFWWENPPATCFSLVTWLLFLAFPKPWKVWDMISQQCYISWEVIDIRSFSSCIASLWSVRLLMKIKMWETSVHLSQRGRKLLLAFYWLGNWHWWKLQYSCKAAKWTIFSAKTFTYSESNVSANCDSKQSLQSMTSFEWWKRHSPTKVELNSFVVFKLWELIPFNPARKFFWVIWNDQQNKVGTEELIHKICCASALAAEHFQSSVEFLNHRWTRNHPCVCIMSKAWIALAC